jgi:two-component system CheB/CheR fusion protein
LDVGPGSLRGLGLGLAICRGIVREHDGSIVATSQGAGKGARFVVEINTVNEPAHAAPRPSSVPPPSSSKARILLVEDHEDTAEILSMLLARGGSEVKVANSVGEALTVDRGAFDVLLSDVGLGDGSGLD